MGEHGHDRDAPSGDAAAVEVPGPFFGGNAVNTSSSSLSDTSQSSTPLAMVVVVERVSLSIDSDSITPRVGYYT